MSNNKLQTELVSLVPIGTKVTSTHLMLWDIVAEQPLPEDDYKHHSFLVAMKMNEGRTSREQFTTLVDSFLNETKGNRGPKQYKKLKRHWEIILLNLSRATFLRHWTLVTLTKATYVDDYWLNKYEFSHTYTKVVVEHLKGSGLIECLPGKRYEGKPVRTRIFPKPELQTALWQFFLDAEQPIEPPYLTVNSPEDEWEEVVTGLSEDHPALMDMTRINEFLKGHEWACKGPVRMTFKHSPFQGGRLITAFQNLPDRKIRLRINTLIDGKPICEVDFSANHLRLNLAEESGEDAGETPYEDIMEIANADGRQLVKDFITIGMGASDRQLAMQAARAKRIDSKLFVRIEKATLKRYPKLSLFTGFGLFAQNLEGQILKRVMLEGVDRGIVALPVHDAVAVAQGNEEWAVEAMRRAWFEYASPSGSNAVARVKVDYP